MEKQQKKQPISKAKKLILNELHLAVINSIIKDAIQESWKIGENAKEHADKATKMIEILVNK